MPWFGAHMSIAGGVHKAVSAAQGLGCETLQIFTASPHSWNAKPAPEGSNNPRKDKSIREEEAALFRQALAAAKLHQPMGHVAYLINLASPDPALFDKSLDAFVEEVNRAEALGLSYLVLHPGSATDGEEEAGLERIAGALDETHRRCPGYGVVVLLENTAGQGSALGHRFEHLRRILDCVKEPERLGVCVDTCHLLAAGYPLATKAEYAQTFDAFQKIVGLDLLRAFHLNDSKKPLGSRVDRHEHIGKGCLGLEPFRMLVNDVRFKDLPMVLETPKEDDDGKPTMDRVNLAALRKLCAKRKTT